MTKRLFFVLALMLFAGSIVYAQTPAATATESPFDLHPIAAGIAMAIASGLCGLGQGKAIASAVEGMGRNPGASAAIQTAMLIGLAFIESLALYTLLIVVLYIK